MLKNKCKWRGLCKVDLIKPRKFSLSYRTQNSLRPRALTSLKLSILLITHDLGVVKEMAEKVYVMYAGQLVEKADRDAFFTEVKHPYSQQLLASLPTFQKRKERYWEKNS